MQGGAEWLVVMASLSETAWALGLFTKLAMSGPGAFWWCAGSITLLINEETEAQKRKGRV